MKQSRLFPLAVILLAFPLLNPCVARAQRGVRAAPARTMTARHTSVMSMPMSRPATFGMGHRNNVVFNNGFFGNALGLGQVSFFPNLNYGIGINGINYVATQDIGTLAAIDPATQWRLALATRVASSVPGVFAGGGYYLLDGGGAYALPAEPVEGAPTPQQQQQPIVVVQQAPAAPAAQAPPAEQAAPAPPLPDAGQFTLVLRNGTQVEAVAFTRMNDRIVYITREGTRRTIPLGDLDADATVRINQERGTPLQLPL